MKLRGVVYSAALGLALLFAFVAEKLALDDTIGLVLWGLAGLCVAVGLLGRVTERGRASGAAKRAESALLLASIGTALALLVYGLSTDAGLAMLGVDSSRAAESGESLVGLLAVLWPTLLGVSGASLLFMELAYRRMPVAQAVEIRRVYAAGFGGAGLALALVFLASVNYVASQRNVVRDLSYFKTTMPSDATRTMVRNLGEKVDVVLFFPETNEVRQQVVPYFEALADESENLEVGYRDHALAPTLTREHRIQDNGYALLLRGPEDNRQGESFEIGTDLERARSRLRTLDGHFQRTFSKLVRQRREIAFTVGHQERNDPDAPSMRGEAVRALQDALERANVTMKDVGVREGLASQVDPETPALMVLGPREPFLPEEVESLIEYAKQGGRLAIFADPDVDHGLGPLLEALGVAIRPGIATSDRDFVPRYRNEADRAIVHTHRYVSHPTVSLASRNQSLVTALLRGGALEETQSDARIEGATVVFPVRSGGQFWLDQDGDYTRGGGESSETLDLMAVVTLPNEGGEEGRAVVIADGEFMTDQLMGPPFANGLIVGDILNWFLGEEQIIGDTTSEEDRPVQLRGEDDQLLFYGTSFGAPLPLLAFGVFVARRRSRRGKKKAKGGAAEDGAASDPSPAKGSGADAPAASKAEADADAESATAEPGDEGSVGADAENRAGDAPANEDPASEDPAGDDDAGDDDAKSTKETP